MKRGSTSSQDDSTSMSGMVPGNRKYICHSFFAHSAVILLCSCGCVVCCAGVSDYAEIVEDDGDYSMPGGEYQHHYVASTSQLPQTPEMFS